MVPGLSAVPPPDNPPPLRSKSPAPGLGRAAASGVKWTGLQAVGVKAVTLVGQVVLGYLLVEEEFGLFALALTVTMLTALVERMGLREVLIQRGRRIDLWMPIAVPFALAVGLSETVLVLAVAPLAAWAYGAPGLVTVMVVLSLQGPPRALAVTAEAKLRTQLRFRPLAMTEGVVAVVSTLLMAGLAFGGFGALSLAIPRPVAAVLRAVMLWRLARPKILPRLYLSRWKLLAGSSSLLLLGNFLVILTQQGDYMLLGLYHDERVVGLYFFAFALSMQAMQLVLANIGGVFLPILSQLRDDPARQAAAYLRAMRLLAAVAIPVGALQAAVADPLFRIVFPARWEPAIPIFQVLSLAVGFAAIASSAGSLLYAQGRFSAKVTLNVLHVVLFAALVVPAAPAGPVPVAGAVLAFWTVCAILNPWVALRLGGWNIFRAAAMPTLVAVAAFGPAAWLIAEPLADLPHLMRAAVAGTVGTAGYVVALRLFLPTTCRDLVQRLPGVLKIKSKSSRAAS